MCEFHLKGNCFHPEIVGKGNIAGDCDVHVCSKCTNNSWQAKMINEDLTYHQALLQLVLGHEDDSKVASVIEMEPGSQFKNPLMSFIKK